METVTINDIFYMLLTCAVPLILRFAYQIVSEKVANTKYADAVNSVYDAVDYVNQTFVDELKKAGNFDAEAQRVAFEKAKNVVLETMRESTYKWMEKAYIDLDGWLTIQIESAVKSRKEAA